MRTGSVACAFCGRRKREGDRLVAGPGVCICHRCLGTATEAAVLDARPRWPAVDPAVLGPRKWPGRSRCSFCGNAPPRVHAIVRAPSAQICTECLEVCNRLAMASPQRPGGA